MDETLESFGRIVATQGRDQGLDEMEMVLSGRAKAPVLAAMTEKLKRLGPEELDAVRETVRASIDAAIHGLLFTLYSEDKVELVLNGVSLKDVSDGLHVDYFGWVGKYSKYPE